MSLKSGGEVSPMIAGILIAIVVLVAGFFIWRATGSKKGEMQNKEQMMKIMQQQFGPGGSGGRTTRPGMPGAPGGAMPGGSTGGAPR